MLSCQTSRIDLPPLTFFGIREYVGITLSLDTEVGCTLSPLDVRGNMPPFKESTLESGP